MGGAKWNHRGNKLFADVTWTRVNCIFIPNCWTATFCHEPSIPFSPLFSRVLFLFSARHRNWNHKLRVGGRKVSLEIHYGFVEILLYRDLRAEAASRSIKHRAVSKLQPAPRESSTPAKHDPQTLIYTDRIYIRMICNSWGSIIARRIGIKYL